MLKLVVLFTVFFVVVIALGPPKDGPPGPPKEGSAPEKRIVRRSPGNFPMPGGDGGSFPNPMDMAGQVMQTAQDMAGSMMPGRRRRNV